MTKQRTPTSVTEAQEAAEVDYHSRVVQYSVSMIIRTICLVLAFVFTGPLRWACVVGAVFLPYAAVVMANAVNKKAVAHEAAHIDGPPPAALPASAPEADSAAEEPVLIEGEVVEDEEDADDDR